MSRVYTSKSSLSGTGRPEATTGTSGTSGTGTTCSTRYPSPSPRPTPNENGLRTYLTPVSHTNGVFLGGNKVRSSFLSFFFCRDFVFHCKTHSSRCHPVRRKTHPCLRDRQEGVPCCTPSSPCRSTCMVDTSAFFGEQIGLREDSGRTLRTIKICFPGVKVTRGLRHLMYRSGLYVLHKTYYSSL